MNRESTMTKMKSSRFVRAGAVVLPAAAMLLAMPALAATQARQETAVFMSGAGLAGAASLGSLGAFPRTSAAAGHIKLAGKLSSAVRGAAIGSRVARGSNRSGEQSTAADEPDTEAEAEAGTDAPLPEGETTPSGPFTVVIPGQSGAAGTTVPTTPPAPSAAADPSASAAIATPGAAQQPAQTPASTNAADSGCIAGCYAPTSAQVTPPKGRRAAGAPQAGRTAPPAAAAQPGVECLAGCDGIEGMQLPRTTSGAAGAPGGAVAAQPSQSGASRVVILRGNTRTKTYGIGQ